MDMFDSKCCHCKKVLAEFPKWQKQMSLIFCVFIVSPKHFLYGFASTIVTLSKEITHTKRRQGETKQESERKEH